MSSSRVEKQKGEKGEERWKDGERVEGRGEVERWERGDREGKIKGRGVERRRERREKMRGGGGEQVLRLIWWAKYSGGSTWVLNHCSANAG